jgi:hypothetical protein
MLGFADDIQHAKQDEPHYCQALHIMVASLNGFDDLLPKFHSLSLLPPLRWRQVGRWALSGGDWWGRGSWAFLESAYDRLERAAY